MPETPDSFFSNQAIRITILPEDDRSLERKQYRTMKSKSNAETKVTVHRVPPPLCRRRVENDGKREWRPTGKTTSRVKSGEPAHVTPLASANDFDTLFAKLDPTDEVQANRMQQRRKQVTMGKNTAGYECYLQQVPKSSRKPRSMDTPSTPDHTLDVPAKRWAGIVRAWYVSNFCINFPVDCWQSS